MNCDISSQITNHSACYLANLPPKCFPAELLRDGSRIAGLDLSRNPKLTKKGMMKLKGFSDFMERRTELLAKRGAAELEHLCGIEK